MADQIAPWSQLQNGAIPLRLDPRSGGGFALGTKATGAGTGFVKVYWSQIASGEKQLKYADDGAGGYELTTSNG